MKKSTTIKVNFEYWLNDSEYVLVSASGSTTPSGRVRLTKITWQDDHYPVPSDVAEDIERVAEVELQREAGL